MTFDLICINMTLTEQLGIQEYISSMISALKYAFCVLNCIEVEEQRNSTIQFPNICIYCGAQIW